MKTVYTDLLHRSLQAELNPCKTEAMVIVSGGLHDVGIGTGLTPMANIYHRDLCAGERERSEKAERQEADHSGEVAEVVMWQCCNCLEHIVLLRCGDDVGMVAASSGVVRLQRKISNDGKSH